MLTGTNAGVHLAAPPTIRSRNSRVAAKRRATGNAIGGDRNRQGELGQDSVQSIVPNRGGGERGTGDGATVGDFVRLNTNVFVAKDYGKANSVISVGS